MKVPAQQITSNASREHLKGVGYNFLGLLDLISTNHK